MSFFDKVLQVLKNGFNNLIEFLYQIVLFLAKPLAYLMQFLEGIFYIFYKLFDIAVLIIMIFVSIFQFMVALTAGVFRTIKMWLTVNPDVSEFNLPNASYQGFQVLVEQLQPTGFMTVVPTIATAVVWFYFVLKVIGLFGGQVFIAPEGRPTKED